VTSGRAQLERLLDVWLRLFAGPLLALAILLYLLRPEGVGGLAFLAVAGLGLTGLMIGPAFRQARPRAPFAFLAVAAGCLGTGLVLRFFPSAASRLGSPDLYSIAGYLAAVVALWLMVGATTQGAGRLAALDAMIVSFSAGLGFFSAEIGPHLLSGSADLAAVALNVLYPVLDSALLSLTVHLAFRTVRRSPSLIMLLAGFTTWLIGDMIYTVVWHFHPGMLSRWPNALFMITYGLMGMAAWHASVRNLAVPAVATKAPTRSGRSVLIIALLVPAAIAILVPVSGLADGLLRVVLLAAVLLCIYLRMTQTAEALHRAEQAALHRALHDPLTGLPNRSAFLADLRRRCAQPGETGLSVVSLDVDRFKQVNDTWGHPAGDELLRRLAERLRTRIRPGDRLYALGGDAFALIAEGASVPVAEALAQPLLTLSHQALLLDAGQSITVSASVGVAQAGPGEPAEAVALIRDADIALHAAKDAGRATWVLFDESLSRSIGHRVRLAEALRRAVAEHRIEPHYQVIMGGPGFATITGFEALARWTDPELGPVSPVEFIPVAEDTGLIVDIGELMLRQACAQLVGWRRLTGRDDLHISVNLSAAQITGCDVPGLVRDVLAETGLPAPALWLEITESLLVADRETTVRILDELDALGVVLCVDDFGTGYSSLSYLTDFPVHVVKIDRSFVRRMLSDPRSRAVTGTIIEMARGLRFRGVVAEGVETAEASALLEEMGCTWGQGFLWARPLPPEAVGGQLLGIRTGDSTDSRSDLRA
jgi:diguanylate cyclase (GGDEF)-like protein